MDTTGKKSCIAAIALNKTACRCVNSEALDVESGIHFVGVVRRPGRGDGVGCRDHVMVRDPRHHAFVCDPAVCYLKVLSAERCLLVMVEQRHTQYRLLGELVSLVMRRYNISLQSVGFLSAENIVIGTTAPLDPDAPLVCYFI